MKNQVVLWLVIVNSLVGGERFASQASFITARPEDVFEHPNQIELARASERGDVDTINQLARSGVAVNAVGKQNATALWYAFGAQQKLSFQRLLELNANPNVINQSGEPLLSYCLMATDGDYLRLLLSHGADPNARNRSTSRPSIFHILHDDGIERLQLMLQSGADVNIKDSNDTTPIIVASSARQIRTGLFLLRHGADPFLRDRADIDIAAGLFGPNWKKEGDVPKMLAEVKQLLEQKGVTVDPRVLEVARIRNLGEATGREPPMWLKGQPNEPNPAWVRAYPEKAEKWYRTVLGREPPHAARTSRPSQEGNPPGEQRQWRN